MAMQRFEGEFHQSDIKDYNRCHFSFYLRRVLAVDREKTSASAIAGTAGHDVIQQAHERQEFNADTLKAWFDHYYQAGIQAAQDAGLEIIGKIEDYGEKFPRMIVEYFAKEYNRQAQIVAAEKEMFFSIKPAKAIYQFSARIDQLVYLPLGAMLADFPWLEKLYIRRLAQKNTTPLWDKLLVHRDLKFGQRRECSNFELSLDVQFDVYAYGLKYGIWREDLMDLTKDPEPINIIPDFHVKYHLADLLPYESDNGKYLVDPDTGGRVKCDLVPEPCKVGKSGKACEGKRKYCTKQRRGPGMYFTRRPQVRLDQLQAELGQSCASIRMGYYPRNLNQNCFKYCGYRTMCENLVNKEIYENDEVLPPDTGVNNEEE